jgi:hypothetical protein
MSEDTNTKQKPQTVAEMVEFFSIQPRAKSRLATALTDDVVKTLTWTTLRALAFACRDPKTSAKDMTLSQKVMMYRKYDKLWESISEATTLYGAKINDVKCQPDIGEDVATFRTRYLQAILGLNK